MTKLISNGCQRFLSRDVSNLFQFLSLKGNMEYFATGNFIVKKVIVCYLTIPTLISSAYDVVILDLL